MTRSRSSNDFPLLKPLGLQACGIRGDGNCLFSALSDQIFGDQSKHAEIRKTIIQYIQEHPDEFKSFVVVGGEQRRNPKRKNVRALPSSCDFTAATDAEKTTALEAYLEHMAQDGTWGGHIEIQAFSHAYNTDVRIYTPDNVIPVNAGPENIMRPTAHIARHTWEHFSSIRNINGPMTGLPHVKELAKVDDWKVKAVTNLVPHLIDQAAIIKALAQNDGDIDNAVSKLLDVEYISSQTSTPNALSSPGSSSIERDSDSDDDVICRPSKRQNRSVEPERSIFKKNIILRMEEAESSGNPSFGVGTDSGYEGAESTHKSGGRPIKSKTGLQKVQRKKKIAKPKAIRATDPTSSESEPELRHLKSNDTVNKSTLTGTAKEKGDDDLDLLAHPTMANINFIGGKTLEDNEGPTYLSDGEADDEYRPDGEDDADSDFTPNSAITAIRSSTLPTKRKVKHTLKNGKLTEASSKLLETTTKNFNQDNISSPIEKVAGMKVLFI